MLYNSIKLIKMTHIYDTLPPHTNLNKRRFTYKYQIIVVNDDGEVIKDKKYCTCQEVAEDNGFSSPQIVHRISSGYKFSAKFDKYKNITVNKIYEKKKTRMLFKRILIEE